MYIPQPERLGWEQVLSTLCLYRKRWLIWWRSFGWDRENRSPLWKQLWHDKDPSSLLWKRLPTVMTFPYKKDSRAGVKQQPIINDLPLLCNPPPLRCNHRTLPRPIACGAPIERWHLWRTKPPHYILLKCEIIDL